MIMVEPEELDVAATQVLNQGHCKVPPRFIAEIWPDCLSLELWKLLRVSSQDDRDAQSKFVIGHGEQFSFGSIHKNMMRTKITGVKLVKD